MDLNNGFVTLLNAIADHSFLTLAAFSFAVFFILSEVIVGKASSTGVTRLCPRLIRIPLILISAFAIPQALMYFTFSSSTQTAREHFGFGLVSLLFLSIVVFSIGSSSFSYDVIQWISNRSTPSRLRKFSLKISGLLVPPIVGISGILVAFGLWGVDVTGLVLASGAIGLVLGLALQDTLSNVFAGFALLGDETIVQDDLIVLPDGRICRVDEIGYRTTKLYYLKENSIIYVPNSGLAGETIANITRPTVDLRVSITIGISYAAQTFIDKVALVLQTIAEEHHSVLVEVPKKIVIVERLGRSIQDSNEKARLGRFLDRLQAEQTLDLSVDQLRHNLISEDNGTLLNRLLHNGYSKDMDERIRSLVRDIKEQMSLLENLHDPWADDPDYASSWMKRSKLNRDNELNIRMTRFLGLLKRSGTRGEIRGYCENFGTWVRHGYKPQVTESKNPEVSFGLFDASSVNLSLDFYVDDIRLNSYRRRDRAILEIATEIKRQFDAKGISIPFPQMDIHAGGDVTQPSVRIELSSKGEGQ